MPESCCGIGHTRWATHGEPTDANAHPHFNQSKTIGIVHNGIIENYLPLKEKMKRRGYQFRSETDSEVIAHMLDYYNTGDPVETIEKVIMRLKGSYALEILFADHLDTIYCVRKDSPLVIAVESQPQLSGKIKSNIMEVKSRGAKICGVAFSKDATSDPLYDALFLLPECCPCFRPSLAILPLQLFAYYVSVAKGIDVDKPRNLAKSVTVE